MDAREVKKMVKRLEATQKALGKHKDKLNDIISECEMLRDECETAYCALQDAREALSDV